MAVLDDIMQKQSNAMRQKSLQPPTAPENETPAPSEIIQGTTKKQDRPEIEKHLSDIDDNTQYTKIRSYADIINATRRPQEISPEDIEKEKKRERSKSAIFAITDTINALNDLYQVSRGAPLSPQVSLSDNNKKRYDERMAKRAAQQEAYLAALEKAGFQDLAEEYKTQAARQQMQHDLDMASMKSALAQQAQEEERKFKAEQTDKEHAYKKDEAEKGRQFTAGQNAMKRDLEKLRVQGQHQKDRYSSLRYFRQSQGDEVPFVLDGKTYVVGSKALNENVGNLARNILEDARNAPQFAGKSDKELMKDMEWMAIKRDLNLNRDPKRLAQAVKSYAKYSPAVKDALSEMARYYSKGKRDAEQGYYYDSSSDYGFIPDQEEDESLESLFD